MHSPKYELVKRYYDSGLWSADRVRQAVGKWITKEEADEILHANEDEDGTGGLLESELG